MTNFKLFAIVAILVSGLSSVASGQHSTIQDRTRMFLDAYASGDRETVIRLIDRANITMYGSDLAEVAHGSDSVLKLMDADQQLWRRSAKIGQMEHVNSNETKELSSIICDVSFSVAGGHPIPIRIVAVWRREGKQWLLVQSSNSVVTERQSAEDLLRRP